MSGHAKFCSVGCFIALWCMVWVARADVVVKQNVSPGATNWPGAPIVSTMSNPSGSATVAESFNGGGGNTNISQTFTVVGGSFTLQTISIYAGGGTNTGPAANLGLNLFDLGAQTAPNPSPYTASIAGPNLFGGGAGLSVSYTNQANGILQFDFTGSDQVALINGHLYAFELTCALNSTPVNWYRATNDTYSGGAAYRNQTWINGNNARDFAMAIYEAQAFETNYPPVPYGIVYHIFTRPINGINPDGANPAAGLVRSGGVLCGTTVNGGMQGSGTAFYLNPDASGFNLIRVFGDPPDASNPQGELVLSGNRFFGTSFGGGTNGTGAIFIGQTNGSVSVLTSFALVSEDAATNSGGASPCGFVAVSGSAVFGATTAGGAFANGTLFSINTNGAALSVLHDFTLLDSISGTNADGAAPWGGLILSGNSVFGTASTGGNGGNGVVFSMSTNGTNFTVLHHFSPMDPLAATNTDGAIPMGGLVLSGDTLYGTTTGGGQGGCGTVFSVRTNASGFAALHHFSKPDAATGTNMDGVAPCAALIVSGSTLYGTAPAGGTGGNGTVYSVRTDGTQFRTLQSFSAIEASNGTNADGAVPVSGLLLLGNALYGTTFSGGPGSAGTVFGLPVPALPATITSIVANPGGGVTLVFNGGPNTTNVVQTSSSVQPPVTWQNVSTNVADAGGAWQFTDVSGTNSTRYYRSYAQ
jgi:uncharacterized repeat protein (TIGR03803 family)